MVPNFTGIKKGWTKGHGNGSRDALRITHR